MTTVIDRAEIIAVGSELLSLQRIDTNSLFLTGQLDELGIAVRAKSVVGDDREDLTVHLRAALARSPLVITTGGLGPTNDDLTRDVVAGVLGREQHEDPAVLRTIAERFARRGVDMPAINRRQAMVASGAVVLPNGVGTAPGLLFDLDGRLLVLLPGPPREMQPMFATHVRPRLVGRSPGQVVRRRVVKVTGRSESQVETVAAPVYSAFGREGVPIETTILASPGQIELHLSTRGNAVDELDRALDDGVRALCEAIGGPVFSTDGRSLEEVVGRLLADRGWRLAAAESCTGGLLVGRLTDVPGSSAWVVGGIVAYDNEVKISQLGVPRATIETHGAVSDEVAVAMATGVRQRLSADVGVGITGVAGPGGGSAEKPVGTVVIAAVTDGDPVVRRFLFPGDRDMVRRFSTAAALDLVRALLPSGAGGIPT